MYKILITGGAGYVGAVLIKHLLSKQHNVTVVDNLMHRNGYSMLSYFGNPQFSFVKGDVRDKALMTELVKDKDFVIHLAAIVGFPACEKNQQLATSVNLDASKMLSGLLSRSQGILYGSTGSNYGNVVGQICTEDTPLKPLSLYGKTKTGAEKQFLDNNTTIAYRFATAFGISPRMRLDLLINDFVYEAVVNKYLIMFEKEFKRTFISVEDMACSFLFAIDNFEKMKDDVYNVGDEKNNFSKEEIALMIKEKVNYYLHFAEIGEDMDKRNYEVSYEKLNKLGFRNSTWVKEGIDQLIKAIPALEHQSPYKNV